MTNRETVIKDIEEYLSSIEGPAPEKRLLLEIKELLKPAKPKWQLGMAFCSKCGRLFGGCGFRYCPDCGAMVGWSENNE